MLNEPIYPSERNDLDLLCADTYDWLLVCLGHRIMRKIPRNKKFFFAKMVAIWKNEI